MSRCDETGEGYITNHNFSTEQEGLWNFSLETSESEADERYLLLIVNFITLLTDLSIRLNLFRTGAVRPSTSSFCLFWMWIETIGYNLGVWLMTWASMERPFLVFHNNWTITFKQRSLTPYIPITLCILYGLEYSAYLVFGYPCQDDFDYRSTLCGYSCAYQDFIPSQYDTIANSMTTIFLIVLFTLSLLFRVLWQKRQFRQGLQWRKNRKMIIQLVSISSIYLIADLPINITYLTEYPASDTIAYDYLSNKMYLVRCFLPDICLTCLPEVWQKLKVFQPKIRPTRAFGNTAGATQTTALRTLASSMPPLE